MYVAPPHALRTCGACGPPYVYDQTGYFLEGSKSGGLIIIASIVKPSRVFTLRNSTFPSLYCARESTLFSSMTRTSLPPASYSRSCVGVFTSDQVSMKCVALELNDGR